METSQHIYWLVNSTLPNPPGSLRAAPFWQSAAYGSLQLQELEENNWPCPPSSSHRTDLYIQYSILTTHAEGWGGGVIAYLTVQREQLWMGEELHGQTHLCFLISEGLSGHFSPFFMVVVEGCHDKTPLHASVEMARGKSQLRITQRQGDVNRHIMIADSPRTLSPFPSQPYTCPSCTILENIIRGKTETDALPLCFL